MCKSIAEGGQRCAAHTRKPGLAAYADVMKYWYAEEEQTNALIAYASTRAGRKDLQAKLDEIPAEWTEPVAILQHVLEQGDKQAAAAKAAAAAYKEANPDHATAKPTLQPYLSKDGTAIPYRARYGKYILEQEPSAIVAYTENPNKPNGLGKTIGFLSWFPGKIRTNEDGTFEDNTNINGGMIHKVMVSTKFRRKGLATAMLQFARQRQPDMHIRHSGALTDDGRAWAEATPISSEPPTPPLPAGVTLAHHEDDPWPGMTLVLAHNADGEQVGFLELEATDEHGSRRVHMIEVEPDYQRQGIATALWRQAKALGLNPQHDDNEHQSDEGRAWASNVH